VTAQIEPVPTELDGLRQASDDTVRLEDSARVATRCQDPGGAQTRRAAPSTTVPNESCRAGKKDDFIALCGAKIRCALREIGDLQGDAIFGTRHLGIRTVDLLTDA
jgi:hypothetical protein